MSNLKKYMEKRIALALPSFGRLRKLFWSNKNILLKLKIRLYRALVLPIVTYTSQRRTLGFLQTKRYESAKK